MEKNGKQILIDVFGKENLKQLPIYYGLMEPAVSMGQLTYAKSKFHSTNAYNSIPFYKPISKIFANADDKRK